ncbi:hypothetical protein K438DRAFT_1961228 [Mycena galopus ATCC 62051]|nr:hypothetical protein K438DRAFT_1961228 [Mycena galopus ATCC 62051]
MSFSSYIQRRARVPRVRRGTLISTTNAALGSILEEDFESELPSTLLDQDTALVPEAEKPAVSKKNSVKARRRLGVPNLAIPRSSPLFTAVQGLRDAEWECLRVLESGPECLLEDTKSNRETLPALLPFGSPLNSESDESESSESSAEGSGSESGRSGSESPMPTTPTEGDSPTAEKQRKRLRRCKHINPLAFAKRASPARQDTDDIWQDDDEFYASHASDFITLSPPLPASFPSTSTSSPSPSTSTSTTAVPRRQSMLITSTVPPPSHRVSVRLSRAFTIPARAPPPPPIDTSSRSHSRSRSSANVSISVSPSASSPASSPRPPPRTPVPTDLDVLRLSQVYAGADANTADVDMNEPFVASRTPSPLSPSTSNTRLAALLSPPSQRMSFPQEMHVVVEDEGSAWEECALDEYAYDEVPLSPLAPAELDGETEEISFGAGDLGLDLEQEGAVEEVEVEGEQWTVVPSPYMGAGCCPSQPQTPAALCSRWSASTSAASPRLQDNTPQTPGLRSRWSASTTAPQTPALRSRWSAATSAAPQTPALRSHWSASTSAFSPRLQDGVPETPAFFPPTPAPVLRSKWSSSTLSSMHSTQAYARSPALRSKWSSSTLSSINSAHGRSPASVKSSSSSFSFARRYFPLKSPSPKSPSPYPSAKSPSKSRPRPMGSASSPAPRKKQRKLTVADVQVHLQHTHTPTPAPALRVVVGGPPATASVLASACASPDVFSSAASFAAPMSPTSVSGQWPVSPTRSSALYAAYTTQRSPRRRVSSASSAGGWSQASSSPSRSGASTNASGSSESGHSECSSSNASASAGSSIRRKPIPVEMFLR